MDTPHGDLHQRLLTARLPALPQVLVRFLDLCRREDAGLDDIARLISQEPAMANRILTLAGRASRYQTRPPKDLSDCLLRIGLDAAKIALVSESVHQVFDALATSRPVDLGHFWRHSLTAAILARRIAKELGYPHVEEAYLAGLLHNVGQLALLSVLPDQYLKVFAQGSDDDWVAHWEALALGLTHAEVGAWLSGRWRLDSYLADALLYHHEAPERLAGAHPLVRVAWLAHALTQNSGADVGLLGLDRDMSLRIQDGVSGEVEKAAELLGVDLERPEAYVAAQAQLVDAVRTMALEGAQQEVRISPHQDFAMRLQAVMTAARTLYGLGDGILYQLADGKLSGRVAWQYLARLEELEVPLGYSGGLVGMAAETGRITTTWDKDSPGSVLDDQLHRALDGEGLICLPVSGARQTAVLAFSLDKEKARLLRTRPILVDSFVKQAGVALDLVQESAAVEAGIPRDRVRRAVHEANNPLSIIRNYLHVLGEHFVGQEVAADIALVSAEIERVGRILRDLTAAGGKDETLPEKRLDLNGAILDLVAFCRDTGFIPPSVQLELTLAESLPAVRGNADSLKQIALNLLKNAIEALNGRGQVGISTTGPVLHGGESYVLLRVSDNGPGIPPEVREHLFEQMETRKGKDHAGLGLAVVGELVAKLGGHIKCSSSEMGTAFDILLPDQGQQGG